MNENLTHLRRSLLSCARLVLVALCLSLTGLTAFSAGVLKDISGSVVDGEGEPLIGATVLVKGTTTACSTDMDGKYTIKAEVGKTIVVSYVGHNPAEAVVGSDNVINFTLSENSQTLDEVVVVGYGTVKKKDLTGSVSSMGGQKVAERHTLQVSSALQGAMAGVQVNRSNGQPGAGASSILIRGVTTISDTDPLIIVDGVPKSSIDDINSNDIESISVLKDAASASIYGARAAAGVILITTKRANEKDARVSYNFEYGLEIPTSQPKQVGFQRYMEMVNELKYNDNNASGWFQEYSQDDLDNWVKYNATDPDNYPITDWYDLLVKGSAPRQSHNISVTAGTRKVKTRATFGYEKQDGLFRDATNTYERYSVRANNDININKFISVNVDLDLVYTERDRPEFTNVWTAIYNYSPAWAYMWSNGGLADVKGGNNPYGRLVLGGNEKTGSTKFGGKASLDITPIDGLKLSAVFSPRLIYTNTKTFVNQVGYNPQDDPTVINGYLADHATTNLTEDRANSKSFTAQFLGNYAKTFGKHDLNVMLGYENYYYLHESISAYADYFDVNNFPYLSLGNKDYAQNSGSAYETAYRSFFGRVMYNYDDRYLAQVNFRRDGSSRFHSDYRWGSFPSVSAGWVISKEKFMEDVNQRTLSFLKLRASWGQLGNERIGSYYPYVSLMNFANSVFYDGTDATSATYYKTAAQFAYAIKNISWETTETYDIGVDARFFDGRLSFTGDFYKKTTKDMLLSLAIPKYLGYDDPDQNAGTMNTTGYDLELSWNDRIGDVSYGVSFNLSDYVSKMGDLKGTTFDSSGKISREGSYYNEWYGYIAEGIFQTEEELANSAVISSATKVGDIKYKDISGPDGVPDGKISAEYDRVLLGNSLPRFLYGGNINLAWKGIDFTLSFQGVGKQNARMTETMVQPYKSNWGAIPAIIDGNYWSENNTVEQNLAARYPRLTYTNKDLNNAMSSFWLFNGAYFRCKNITLGYTLPQQWTRKAYINSVRVYVSGNDLFTFNHYPTGFDPERTATSYPLTRSVLFGLNVNF